jgi:hypothetical protein
VAKVCPALLDELPPPAGTGLVERVTVKVKNFAHLMVHKSIGFAQVEYRTGAIFTISADSGAEFGCKVKTEQDRLGIPDAAIIHHLPHFRKGQFQNFDVFAFMGVATAFANPGGLIIVGEKQRHLFGHRAW